MCPKCQIENVSELSWRATKPHVERLVTSANDFFESASSSPIHDLRSAVIAVGFENGRIAGSEDAFDGRKSFFEMSFV